jgi:cell division septal protein FtsQ
MKARKKQKRASQAPFAQDAKAVLVTYGTWTAAALAVIISSYLLGMAYISRCDHFRLKTVETRSVYLDQKSVTAVNAQILNLYKGLNIFKINLKNVASFIQKSYPDAKEVAVRVVLPDKLLVTMKFRRPVAVVRGNKRYPVDDEGFVLPNMDAASIASLPVIDGVSVRYDERRGGKAVSKNLALALELLKEIRRTRFMAEYGLDAIDAAELNSMSFYLKNGVQVKIGCEDFAKRLASLDRTLKDPRLLLDRIQYIDVRFKDVYIGPK